MDNAEVTRRGFLDMQVCVPSEWDDFQVKLFADRENPAGTTNGWQVRKEGHDLLADSPERAQCVDHADRVHIMLDC